MCWECSKTRIKLTVDSTDKTVYKVLAWNRHDKQLTAWYIPDFKYNLGCTYHSQIELIQPSTETDIIEVQSGLHSYLDIPKKFRNGVGVHNREHFKTSQDIPLVARCVIPAGTLYGVGINNELVSTILYFESILSWDALTFIPGSEEDAEYARQYKEIYNLIYSK
jgi:hypothetical protein